MLYDEPIPKWVKPLFDPTEPPRPAAEVLPAVLWARSPRLTDSGRTRLPPSRKGPVGWATVSGPDPFPASPDAAGRMAGGLLREKAFSPKRRPPDSGRLVLLHADGRQRKTWRAPAKALDALFQAPIGPSVPT